MSYEDEYDDLSDEDYDTTVGGTAVAKVPRVRVRGLDDSSDDDDATFVPCPLF